MGAKQESWIANAQVAESQHDEGGDLRADSGLEVGWDLVAAFADVDLRLVCEPAPEQVHGKEAAVDGMATWISKLLETGGSMNSAVGPEWSLLVMEYLENSQDKDLQSKVDSQQHCVRVRVEINCKH